MRISAITQIPSAVGVKRTNNDNSSKPNFGKLCDEDLFRKQLEECDVFSEKEKKKTLNVLDKIKDFLNQPKFDELMTGFVIFPKLEKGKEDEGDICYIVAKTHIDEETGERVINNDTNDIIALNAGIEDDDESVDNIVRNLERFTRSRGLGEDIQGEDEKIANMKFLAFDDEPLPPSKENDGYDPFSNEWYSFL